MSAMGRIRKGGAVGIYGIPVEYVIGISEEIMDGRIEFLELFNEVLASGVYPNGWRAATLVPIPKGGNVDDQDPNNYRGISLLCCIYKIFTSLLERRLTRFFIAMGARKEEQFGFRADSVPDNRPYSQIAHSTTTRKNQGTRRGK